MQPLRANTQYAVERRDEAPYPRYRSLAPVYDLRINVHTLFEYSLLKANKGLRGKAIVPILLSDSVRYPTVGTTHVWLRCYPEAEKSVFDFIDPNAEDLRGSSRVFCRVFTYPNREGYLYNLVAPSFRGKTAVKLVQNFMALSETKALLLSDVTTMIGCCKGSGLNSLHLHQVITTGESWYKAQGAIKKIYRCSFPLLHDEQYVDPGYQIELQKPVAELDYSAYRAAAIRRRFDAFASDEAYSQACTFLQNVKTATLINGFETIGFRNHVDCLVSAKSRWHLPDTCTLGAVLHEATARGNSYEESSFPHKIMHELRDLFISNKDSDFANRLCNYFQTNRKQPSLHGLALVFFVLTSYSKLSEENEIPQDIASESMGSLVHPENKKDSIAMLTNNFKKTFLELIERERGTPIQTKICAHSTAASRRKWIEYLEPINHDDDTVLKEALIYLLNLDLGGIRQCYPEWAVRFEGIFKKAGDPHATIISHFSYDIRDEKFITFCFDLLASAMENFSVCSARLFQAYRGNFPTQEADLFMIAKYIIKRSELFQFQLDE